MKELTRLMIDTYNMKKIDFMGYYFNKKNASYHHLIIPKRNGGKETFENGVVLNGQTSHPYLHIIESIDEDIFDYITLEMIEEKYLCRVDEDSIRKIDDALHEFEKEYSGRRTSKGKILIKPEYVYGRKLRR